jgi:hypothetical protein
MKTDHTYELLVAKMQEVSDLPLQKVGVLTPIYKRIVPHLKYYPWKSVFLISCVAAAMLYLMFGIRMVRLASLLQFGF